MAGRGEEPADEQQRGTCTFGCKNVRASEEKPSEEREKEEIGEARGCSKQRAR